MKYECLHACWPIYNLITTTTLQNDIFLRCILMLPMTGAYSSLLSKCSTLTCHNIGKIYLFCQTCPKNNIRMERAYTSSLWLKYLHPGDVPKVGVLFVLLNGFTECCRKCWPALENHSLRVTPFESQLIRAAKRLNIVRVLTILINTFSCICEGQSWRVP